MKSIRKLAIESADAYYFTGKPCLRGHLSKRKSEDGSCWECRLEKQRAERANIRGNAR
jgi:hypothetical protein